MAGIFKCTTYKKQQLRYYAHVLSDHKGPVVLSEKRKPTKVILLNSGKSLPFEYNKNDRVTIPMQDSDRDMLDDVIKLVYSD